MSTMPPQMMHCGACRCMHMRYPPHLYGGGPIVDEVCELREITLNHKGICTSFELQEIYREGGDEEPEGEEDEEG